MSRKIVIFSAENKVHRTIYNTEFSTMAKFPKNLLQTCGNIRTQCFCCFFQSAKTCMPAGALPPDAREKALPRIKDFFKKKNEHFEVSKYFGELQAFFYKTSHLILLKAV